MTTHTDLIKRLRALKGPARLAAADALQSLEQQVASLVAERAKSAEQYVARLNQIDALTKELENMTGANMLNANALRIIKEKLAAAQAREAKMREALVDYDNQASEYDGRTSKELGDRIKSLLASPTDDSALQERLKEERDAGYIEALRDVREGKLT